MMIIKILTKAAINNLQTADQIYNLFTSKQH